MSSARPDHASPGRLLSAPLLVREPDRHQHLREVAASLFANRGYANVGLRQLAEHLGIQSGSIYSHIESKQVLLYELIRDHLENLQDHVEWQVKKSAGVEEKLRAFIAGHIEFQLQHRALSQLSVLELRSLEPEYRREIADLQVRYREYLEGIIGDGMKAGVFHSQPLSVASHCVLGLLSSIVLWFGEDAAFSMEQLIKHYTAMVWPSQRRVANLPPASR
ncbi:hypothetical protein B7H20_27685 [Pseudomonas aeruginosa]|uniref:TetR family transcriptional regulator n=1 Tax=Pseudomonas psychrophila TaxID=122355 RepID=A0A8I1FZB3_9PSED|nr:MULTISPECIES: TetR/AcrR family transcriptional regulator [Pseudomonadaceae]MBJ2260105.1 TetR family transcriptional regulator [Pseudomonas psychrophila]ORL55159.1 hypothetical protein B7H20_27685 [Pseudomonas aeruginosa]